MLFRSVVFHGLQAADALSDFVELRVEELHGGAARCSAVVADVEQVADLGECQADALASFDELDAGDGSLVVGPVTVRRAGWWWQEAGVFLDVVTIDVVDIR